jgi:hypothetical protein
MRSCVFRYNIPIPDNNGAKVQKLLLIIILLIVKEWIGNVVFPSLALDCYRCGTHNVAIFGLNFYCVGSIKFCFLLQGRTPAILYRSQVPQKIDKDLAIDNRLPPFVGRDQHAVKQAKLNEIKLLQKEKKGNEGGKGIRFQCG